MEETVTWCYDGDLSNSTSMASRDAAAATAAVAVAAAAAAYRLNRALELDDVNCKFYGIFARDAVWRRHYTVHVIKYSCFAFERAAMNLTSFFFDLCMVCLHYFRLVFGWFLLCSHQRLHFFSVCATM